MSTKSVNQNKRFGREEEQPVVDDLALVKRANGLNLFLSSEAKIYAKKMEPRVKFVPMIALQRGKMKEMSYIEVYGWDADKHREERKKLYQFNGHQTTLEKQAFAEQYAIPALRRLLIQGYAFKKPEKNTELDDTPPFISTEMSLVLLLHAAYADGKQVLSPNSLKGYRTTIRVVVEFARTNVWARTWPWSDITNLQIKELQTWVRSTRSKSAINNFNRDFSALCGRAYRMGAEFAFSPKYRLEKVKKQRNTVLRSRDRIALEKAIALLHPQLMLATAFVQYAFVRSGDELCNIRVRDIHLAENELYLGAHDSKNSERSTALIPQPLREILLPMRLDQMPGTWFLLGRNGKPGPTGYSANHFSTIHRECVLAAGLDADRYNLYSWRSTGAYRAITEFGHSILWLMRQMRHSSLAITSEYLSGIGLDHLRDMQAVQAVAQASLPTADTPQSKNRLMDLMRLSAMHREKLLTTEEFESFKKDLL